MNMDQLRSFAWGNCAYDEAKEKCAGSVRAVLSQKEAFLKHAGSRLLETQQRLCIAA